MSQATLGSGPYRNSNLFSGYYLDERVDDLDDWESDDEAEAAFEDLRELWELEGDLVSSYGEDELIDQWISEVLDILGFGTISEGTLPDGGGYVDRLLYESDEARRNAAERKLQHDQEGMFSRASALLEAKQWGHDFEKRFSEERSYRDASHQVKYYLERTPGDLQWGILTDGKKWRLYGTKDYETQTYYEVDLPELLESGDLQEFKYFYCFFRPEAFVEVAGTSFLETVWSESETAAQQLGEDLQDNVFTALRILGKGFVENNDLDIDPEDEAARGELKEQSLVLLYRLMFVLYAESRGLIDPEAPSANREYHENFSLEEVRGDIIEAVEDGDVESGDAFDEEYSEFSTTIWNRLSRLFELIDEGEEELDIPPYNGGLFDHDDHEFLAENEVSDPAIAEVIFRLSTTQNEAGEYVPADYADLDTRHLGSIYEGLLEHEFRIAPEEGMAAVSEDGGQVWKRGDEVSVAEAVETVESGGLYVVNDEGERKATGAYYTPDYVVTYIVEETVDPLIEEIHADLESDGLDRTEVEYFRRFYDRVTDLTILDPAMGSGHFLTKATGYLTEQVMEVVREQEIQSYDEQDIRREISKEAIYGVDLNGMAVELAKLSMWLETLAADQPLAFLDHHLKPGNSLVGSDISEVLSEDGPDGDDDGQITLTQAFARVRQDTLEHVMELMADLLAYDNETLADVKSMEELYDEIRDDPLYTRLFELANVHTAEEFGVDVPEGSYEQMAGAIEDEGDWAEIRKEDWFTAAQATADEQDFFHWELEFPEVFFDAEGEKMGEAGFDAVVGNPPYGAGFNATYQTYLGEKYDTAGNEYDSYTFFVEQGINLTTDNGNLSYIVPVVWTKLPTNEPLRRLLLHETHMYDIQETGEVFKGVVVATLIFCAEVHGDGGTTRVGLIDKEGSVEDRLQRLSNGEVESYEISQEEFKNNDRYKIDFDSVDPTERTLIQRLESESVPLGDITDISQGITPYDSYAGQDQEIIDNRAYHADKQVDESYGKWLGGRDVSRYEIDWDGEWLSYGDWLAAPREEKYFTSPRLLFREVTGGINRVISTYTESEFYYGHSVIPAITEECDWSGEALLAVVNSRLMSWYNQKVSPNAQKETFPKMNPDDVKRLPVHKDTGQKESTLEKEAKNLSSLKNQRSKLNTNLIDYIDQNEVSVQLGDIGLFQPASKNSSELTKTSEDLDNLRIGTARIDRESPNTVLVEATARYKPDDEDAHETDQWGYTETEYLPAFRTTDLTEREADLIEHFVPVAVDEAGGFANFRETATKTNSLIDRLKAIELPDIDDVADDLENYLKTKARAEELDEKIEQTDQLIDEIVYELYGLTDEEIEIVEEAVGE